MKAKKQKKRVSAVLVVYNEEKRIKKCLDSIKNVVDEIIVVHDGPCHDSTLEICRSYTNKIFIRPHVGEAEPHRPFAIQKTTGDWVLFIDADERLSPQLSKNIRRLINQKNVDAYSFLWQAEITGKKSRFLYKLILFRKSMLYQIGLPHFQPETKGRVCMKNYALLHEIKQFNSPIDLLKSYFQKDIKWAKVTARFLSQDLKKIPVYNCDLENDNFPQIKKIKLVRKFPLFFLFLWPVYSFLISYLVKKNYKDGFLGLTLSLHTPIHHFFAMLFLIFYKIKNLNK